MNLVEEMRSELVSHMDLDDYCATEAGESTREVIGLMRERNVPTCLIMSDGRLTGIFTVRDALRRVSTQPEKWDRPIESVMTAHPVTIEPEASIAEAIWLMSERNIRDLPVVRPLGEVVGSLSYQTIIDYLAARFPTEILNVPPRPNAYPETEEGG